MLKADVILLAVKFRIAYERTIRNSQSTNNYSAEKQIICLQPNNQEK
jgi:hypothetical protein